MVSLYHLFMVVWLMVQVAFFSFLTNALTPSLATDWSRSSSPSDTIFNSLDGREPCCNVLGMGWFMWDWWGGNSHWTLFFVEDGIWGVLHFFSILNQLVDSSYTYEILLAYHQFHQKLDILNSHEILWAYHIDHHSTGFCMLAKCSTDRRSTIRGLNRHGGFLSHWDIPIAGWFISRKIRK